MPIAEPKWKENTLVTNDSNNQGVNKDSLFFYEPPTIFQAMPSLIFP